MKDHESAKLVKDLCNIVSLLCPQVGHGFAVQQLHEQISRRLVPEIDRLHTIESDLLNSIAMQ